MAQVRYLKAERAGPGAQEHVSHWVATIGYTYTTPAADPRARRWNPLGFRLLDFVAEPEVISEQALAGATPSTTVAANPARAAAP
jgi:type IV secretion system protein VirB8